MEVNTDTDFDELAIIAYQTVIVNTAVIEGELEENKEMLLADESERAAQDHQRNNLKNRLYFNSTVASLH